MSKVRKRYSEVGDEEGRIGGEGNREIRGERGAIRKNAAGEGEEAKGKREKCTGNRRCLYFAAVRRGWTEEGIDLREVLPGKILLQSSETIRHDSWRMCEHGGGKRNVDETREKKIPMERG